MIPRLAPGEDPTAKLNQVIDALNSGQIISSPDLAVERSPGGTRLSVPVRPRDLYGIITEHPDRPRDLNGDVPDGEYEWAQVFLNAVGEFQTIEGQGLHSYFDVESGLLFNPAYEITGDKTVEVGAIVRMRPYQPIHEEDTEEREGRGFLRRYVFSFTVGAMVQVVEIQPNEGKRYGTVNHMGVFDSRIVTLDPEQGGDLREADWDQHANVWVLALRETCEGMTQVTYTPPLVGAFQPGEQVEQENTGATGWVFEDAGGDLWIHTDHNSVPFSGDAADVIVGQSSGAEATPASVQIPQSTVDEEKLNLLPSYTRFKGLLIGHLDFDGDDRPLYVIDAGPIVRQFELLEDWVQNADETWPLHVTAGFVDQPEAPGFQLYRASELENDALSAHYVGIGRKSWAGHHGSLGWCRWSPATKRWEILDALFKTVALGVVTEGAPGIGLDSRGDVEVWWKDPVAPGGADPWTGAVASGATVQALNFTAERIFTGTRVVLAFDRQENLWMIVDVQFPVMIDGTDGVAGFQSEVGQIVFDDVVPGAPAGTAYFILTHPGGTRSITQVNVLTSGETKAFNAAQWAAVNTMAFANGLMVSWT